MSACGEPQFPSAAMAAWPICVAGDCSTDHDRRPREEQRIVTFIDLVGSTGIAERIGSVGFHAFLSDILTRLSLVVAEFGGEVHRHVGDTLIATWPLGTAQENARAIRCMFACRAALDAAGAEIVRRHGHIPRFRASIHCGPLVAGEIGGAKRESVLVGDAMNVAARIEQTCRATGHSFLASRALIARAAIPLDVVATSIGRHELRGKSAAVELFTLERGVAGSLPCHLLKACA